MANIEQAKIDADAARLRAEGKTYRQIAEIQRCDVSTAFARVERACKAVPVEAVESLRTVEIERLDLLQRVALEQLVTDQPKIDHGRVVRDDDGTPMIDQAAKLTALDKLLKIAERRARLLGLDQPTRIAQEVTVFAAGSEIDREVERLAQQLATLDPGPSSGGIENPVDPSTGEGDATPT
jgi:uncharacterized protein YicC (UPF0701 family)